MIRRHTTSAIVMHWFNAACWLTLLGSGFALMSNPAVQPVGMWWPGLWEWTIGAGGTLTLHIIAGLVWLAAYVVYLPFHRSEALSFLREIVDISLVRDMSWCMGKGLQLILGKSKSRELGPKFGLGTELPPQGFYNAGQKLMAVAVVICGLGLAVSGLMLLVLARQAGAETALQLLLLFHFCCAGTMAVLVPVHIYMAALAPGEGPALRSMLTGFVPEEFARHHNPLWYDALPQGEPSPER
ncbi:MAG: cytochrome b/b6 domain-containing protein [Syntrophobacter sp.]